jgi:hypothetical protein
MGFVGSHGFGFFGYFRPGPGTEITANSDGFRRMPGPKSQFGPETLMPYGFRAGTEIAIRADFGRFEVAGVEAARPGFNLKSGTVTVPTQVRARWVGTVGRCVTRCDGALLAGVEFGQVVPAGVGDRVPVRSATAGGVHLEVAGFG